MVADALELTSDERNTLMILKNVDKEEKLFGTMGTIDELWLYCDPIIQGVPFDLVDGVAVGHLQPEQFLETIRERVEQGGCADSE